MHKKKLYGTATVGTKGQVVIPAEAREALDIAPGDRLYVVGAPDKKWVGFLKEEQLRMLVESQMSDAEDLRSALEKTTK